MRCYNLIMITDQISTSSYIRKLSKREFNVCIDSDDGKNKIESLLNQTVLSGGKHLRPMLTHLTGCLAGVDDDVLHILSRSIEFVHAASLAHDDVIDNANLRRGKPSINVAGDNKMAVLSGDFLLAEVINDLCDLGNIQIVSEMANIIKRLSKGEWIQHDRLKSRNYKREDFRNIALLKTSSVLEWCFSAPFIYCNFSKEVISCAKSLGENLGLSFQLYDDLLDFSDDSEKDKLLDMENGQLTLISYLYLEKNGLMPRYQAGEELTSLINFDEIKPILCDVKILADEYQQQCEEHLNLLVEMLNLNSNNNDVRAIKYLLDKLKNRKK